MTNNIVEKTTKKQLGGVTGKGFMPGKSGNPKGRPLGSGLSITTEIKKKLAELSNDDKKATNLQVLVNTILEKAIKDKDERTITRIWSYIDGMPSQSHKLTGEDGGPIEFANLTDEQITQLIDSKIGKDRIGGTIIGEGKKD